MDTNRDNEYFKSLGFRLQRIVFRLPSHYTTLLFPRLVHKPLIRTPFLFLDINIIGLLTVIELSANDDVKPQALEHRLLALNDV